MTAPDLRVERTDRRVRVRLGGHVVADSFDARLLIEYGPGALPTYYLPRADVRPECLVDEGIDWAGRRSWTVTAGHRRAEAAAWPHPDQDGELAGRVTFSWQALEWYEEDERVLVHAKDPYKRVDTLRSSRRVEVHVAGELVAVTTRPLMLFETSLPTRYYLPFEDVRRELLEPSDLVTSCPYKGTARYWSVRVGDVLLDSVAWSYPDPIPENPKIKDLLCFFNERVDLTVDGVRLKRPHTAWSVE